MKRILERRLGPALLLAAIIGIVAGCADGDLSSIRVKLNADGSGTVVVLASRVVEGAPGFAGPEIRGLDWGKRSIQLAGGSGTFKKPGDLDIAGIKLDVDGKRLRVTLPLGEGARWLALLAPRQKDVDELRAMAKEQGLAVPAGSWKCKILLSVPGKVVAAGTRPNLGGGGGFLPAGGEKSNEAEIVLALQSVLQATEKEAAWDVTWE